MRIRQIIVGNQRRALQIHLRAMIQRAIMAHTHYPCRVYANVGNHDCVYGDYTYLPQQSLGVLFASKVFHRLYDEHEAVFSIPGPTRASPPALKVRVVGVPYHGGKYDLTRLANIKKGDEVIGNETRVKVVKNKVAPPFREAIFDILYGEGTSREGEIIELGVLHKLVDKSGSWYAYNGEKIGQGKDNAREYLKSKPQIAEEIEARIRVAVKVPSPAIITS